ncbi:LysR family transcriptional regulator [Paraburkholderia caballeronis]|uniref:LysR family transcriptional regulator n=1 Tax=Paraburkholderia caballeronis TaxID=416943 RepID=UPI0010E5608F|nr:LysR substrate-binding domain-containing protein [Paraburkholderia caballeronis]TDV19418.1 LysR family transcriptional regulator [Paraburkholderia caballeronis]TDV22018.1 LysR family transcriptional regulator [Paraburkholderia caballeronis]TDV28922.1 LysR family transcriptional regulator [Paraburkholderia caballeronis]TDV39448.1 LysR family transcriptional regulator [Paraburkholderia caballeronis]
MKFHQLKALIAVAEGGSIHEASRDLHVTQPAISKALADLEAELGAPLLVRSAKGAQLTHYGQSLIRHARAIDQELRHAHEDIATLLGVARGTVSVGVTPVTATGPFAEALRRFMLAHPQVTVNVREMRPTLIHEGLADGTVDFGLVSRIGPPVEPRFHWEELYTVPTTLAVRTGHPLRGPKSLAVLAESGWLSWDALDDASSLVGSLFSSHGVEPPKSVLRCTSTVLYVEMATTTDLISLWSELPFHIPEYNAKLRRLALKEPLPDMTVGLVCRDLKLATSVASTFIGLIRECSANIGGLYRRAGAVPRLRGAGPSR